MLLLAFRALGVAGLDVTCNYAKTGGGIFGDACTSDGVQKYEYNGKKLDRTHGLDTYDYGARMYDETIKRLLVIRESAAKHISVPT